MVENDKHVLVLENINRYAKLALSLFFFILISSYIIIVYVKEALRVTTISMGSSFWRFFGQYFLFRKSA